MNQNSIHKVDVEIEKARMETANTSKQSPQGCKDIVGVHILFQLLSCSSHTGFSIQLYITYYPDTLLALCTQDFQSNCVLPHKLSWSLCIEQCIEELIFSTPCLNYHSQIPTTSTLPLMVAKLQDLNNISHLS